MSDKIAKAWEQRSRLFKSDRRSVMEQSFPLMVNQYIEGIHLREITSIIGSGEVVCLDVGCGYGRLAKEITKKKPKLFIHGIDIAPTFVKLFNKILKKQGKAVVADMRKLPYKDNFFDYIWVVVSLMYLETKQDRERGIQELFRVLKPDGKILLIEPNKLGVGLVRLWGVVPYLYRVIFRKKKIETFGIAFKDKEINQLIKSSGGKVIYQRGYPGLTLLLFPSVILGRFIPFLARILLLVVGVLDSMFHASLFSYSVTYFAIKKP